MKTITLNLNEDQLMGLLMTTKDDKRYWQQLWQQGGQKVDRIIMANYANLYSQLIKYKPFIYKKTLRLTKNSYKLVNINKNKEMK